MKKTISFIMSGVLLTSFAFGATATELENKLKQNANAIEQKTNQINQVKKEQNGLLDDIEELNVEINEAEKELETIQGQINDLNSKINAKQKEIDDAQKKMDEENLLLQKRVRAMYESGDAGYAKMLLQSENVLDLVKRYELANQMIEADQALVDNLTKLSAEIKTEKVALEEDKAVVEMAKKHENENRNKLAASRSSKDSKLRLLQQDEKELQKQLDREMEESKAIEEELKVLLGQSTVVYDNSAFIWPLPATSKKITCQYGYRTHPVTGQKNSFHTGIDIGNAPTGTNIYASKSGKVIKAGWNTAYGNMIIIDHGNGVTTLYGHASKLLVSVGDTVKQGDIIAKVGSTGYSTGPHLHFEFRENGSSVDPKKYINY